LLCAKALSTGQKKTPEDVLQGASRNCMKLKLAITFKEELAIPYWYQ